MPPGNVMVARLVQFLSTMTIVLATDFSPCSRAALRLAAAVAKRRGQTLSLVNVLEPPFELTVAPLATCDWERDLLQASEVALAREAGEVRQQGVAVETRVLFGLPATAILEHARGNSAELIVVGTHGSKGAAHLLLGSVAERVVRGSACPVLVTRDVPAELERWEGRSPLRLVVAADGSDTGETALSSIHSFNRAHPCEVSLVRIYSPSVEERRYGLDDPWGGPRHDPRLLTFLERDLRRDAESLLGPVPARLRLRAAEAHDAGDALAEEATACGADALIIGISRHRAGRSVVATPGATLRAASVPVLCVPVTEVETSGPIPQLDSLLVATDLSEASSTIVRTAYGLLRAGGGTLQLCHVHTVGGPDQSVPAPLALPLDDRQRKDLTSRLETLIPHDAERYGITTNVTVLEGRTVPETILAAAERMDAGAIVLGSHGRSGVTRAVLGSVAEAVTRQSARPVVIVRSRHQSRHQ
jgi:nucleotide-binding universal stress UspA family protein